MRLFYVRHGLTDWNAAGRLQGRLDVPLNQIGRAQAAHCGEILRDLLARDGLAAADLDPAEMLLLGEGDCFREQVLAAFPHLNPKPQPVPGEKRNFTRGSTLDTLRHMVASRLGVTILPQSAADASLYAPQLLVTRPFASPVPTRTLALCWRVSFPRHKAIDVLRRSIQASSSAYWNYNTARDRQTPGLLVENQDW